MSYKHSIIVIIGLFSVILIHHRYQITVLTVVDSMDKVLFFHFTPHKCTFSCEQKKPIISTRYHGHHNTYLSSGVLAKYSRSINPSIRFLITSGEGRNLDLSCSVTSATRPECCIRFRAFMIRTMAASISCFRSSSTLLLVSFRSGSDSPLAVTV